MFSYYDAWGLYSVDRWWYTWFFLFQIGILLCLPQTVFKNVSLNLDIYINSFKAIQEILNCNLTVVMITTFFLKSMWCRQRQQLCIMGTLCWKNRVKWPRNNWWHKLYVVVFVMPGLKCLSSSSLAGKIRCDTTCVGSCTVKANTCYNI